MLWLVVSAASRAPPFGRPIRRHGTAPASPRGSADTNMRSTRVSCVSGPDNLEVVDMVRVPADLAPGAYVVQWRWDCEESSQVWLNCGDVTVHG